MLFTSKALPLVEHSEPIFITKPGRILSFDETRLQLDMTTASRANALRSVVTKDDTSREYLAGKGGGDASGVGGSTAAGDSLPGLFIIAGNGFVPAYCLPPWAPHGPPVSSLIDPATDMPFPATFSANKKGGMEWALSVKYFKSNIVDILKPTAEDPIVVICDGHGSHMTLQLINFCRENNIVIVMRPPHTTHKLQGEDVQNFKNIKADFLKSKMQTLVGWWTSQSLPRKLARMCPHA